MKRITLTLAITLISTCFGIDIYESGYTASTFCTYSSSSEPRPMTLDSNNNI